MLALRPTVKQGPIGAVMANYSLACAGHHIDEQLAQETEQGPAYSLAPL